jgi:putative hydrolases of HD superfamily
MYRMSLMTMLAPPSLASRLDMAKCMRMCLIHDMAESLVGDITPFDGVSKPEKAARELAAMEYIGGGLLGNVNGGAVGRDIQSIWREYEDSQTLESQFVHDIDKVELLLQMVAYEKRGAGKVDLGEFAYVATKVTLPETKEWAAELLKERELFWAGRKHLHGEEGVGGGLSVELTEMQNEYYQKGE